MRLIIRKTQRYCPGKCGGMTMLELVVTVALLLILTGMALPVARFSVKREKEKILRNELWEMRDAIDKYKDAADRGAFRIKIGTEGYPADLETMVKGEEVNTKKVRFLHKIPKDPMTNNTDWGLRSLSDDPDSTSWGGENVFDVYSKSEGTALDGSKYKDW